MIIVSALIALYYNVVIAVCIHFFFASMTSKLPWSSCEDERWASCYCRDSTMNQTDPDPWNYSRPECGSITSVAVIIFLLRPAFLFIDKSQSLLLDFSISRKIKFRLWLFHFFLFLDPPYFGVKYVNCNSGEKSLLFDRLRLFHLLVVKAIVCCHM